MITRLTEVTRPGGARRTLVVFSIVVVTYFSFAGTWSDDECVQSDNVLNSGRPVIELSELTLPARGHNILATTHEDRITATVGPPTASAHIEIRLIAGPEIPFWKGVEVRTGERSSRCYLDAPGRQLVPMAEVDADRRQHSTSIRNDLAESSTLIFWKGKTGNAHTPMYQLRGNLEGLEGRRITIFWESD